MTSISTQQVQVDSILSVHLAISNLRRNRALYRPHVYEELHFGMKLEINKVLGDFFNLTPQQSPPHKRLAQDFALSAPDSVFKSLMTENVKAGRDISYYPPERFTIANIERYLKSCLVSSTVSDRKTNVDPVLENLIQKLVVQLSSSPPQI